MEWNEDNKVEIEIRIKNEREIEYRLERYIILWMKRWWRYMKGKREVERRVYGLFISCISCRFKPNNIYVERIMH